MNALSRWEIGKIREHSLAFIGCDKGDLRTEYTVGVSNVLQDYRTAVRDEIMEYRMIKVRRNFGFLDKVGIDS